MKRFIRRSAYFIATVSIVLAPAKPAAAAAAIPPASPLVISEVQVSGRNSDGAEDGRQEFVELYNILDIPVPLEGLQLEYLSASHDGSSAPTRILAALQGVVAPHGFLLVSSPSYIANADQYFADSTSSSSGSLARSGGHVRISDKSGTTMDLVGWGTATAIGGWWRAPELPAGMSIQRQLPTLAHYSSVFDSPTDHLTPQTATIVVPDPEAPPSDPDPPSPPFPAVCKGIHLNELLPNASGADTGKEFIELYNPTDAAVPLGGCSLRLGSGGASFALPEETLAAGGYRVLYDSETHLTLPNATAQTLWLLTADGQESATYADAMDEDVSWAFIGGEWTSTQTLTPGTANVATIDVPAQTKQPTIKTAAVTVAAECTTGKERNPATNRCRTIITATAELTPCKPGQARSADTNRCRSVAAANTAAKPCPAGQVRNAETNRCRKSASTTTQQLASVKDVAGKPIISNYRWWIAGAIAIMALTYAMYEWRRNVRLKVQRLCEMWQRPKLVQRFVKTKK